MKHLGRNSLNKVNKDPCGTIFLDSRKTDRLRFNKIFWNICIQKNAGAENHQSPSIASPNSNYGILIKSKKVTNYIVPTSNLTSKISENSWTISEKLWFNCDIPKLYLLGYLFCFDVLNNFKSNHLQELVKTGKSPEINKQSDVIFWIY